MQQSILLSLLALGLVACSTPKALFTLEGDQRAPATIQFKNNSTDSETYEWDFGSEGTSDQAEPSFSFSRAGNYLVSLRAKKGKKEDVSYQSVLIEGPSSCLVQIETDYGNMVVKLYNETPGHQANFLKLAEEGFYDSLMFHRVMQGFMIQGGDPNSRYAKPNARLGTGGPGYTIPAEFVDTLVHVKGALAAARTGDQSNPERRSSGSQFYLVQGRPTDENTLKVIAARGGFQYGPNQIKQYLELGGYPPLDQSYTVFGQVIEGLEVIDKITAERTNSSNRPLKDVRMRMKVIDYFIDKKP